MFSFLKAFNDVERKYKPTEDVIAYKKETALEQTKSKKSLAEVYEDDYLKKQSVSRLYVMIIHTNFARGSIVLSCMW